MISNAQNKKHTIEISFYSARLTPDDISSGVSLKPFKVSYKGVAPRKNAAPALYSVWTYQHQIDVFSVFQDEITGILPLLKQLSELKSEGDSICMNIYSDAFDPADCLDISPDLLKILGLYGISIGLLF